ncbi:PulJ/GspJ family protein [Sulfuricurvum sp.]|uniref:PulJ/GspJ family protein n=1 Tax=Sulfuricurvum sp. TaxID=2025608 RepID=UPI002E31486B|nr:prepilin-type N-terminal cleavage/methylation domain-containing protein [Sulfuricurvum sp.]HEX5330202.1 prepilin-type N-terminal cleavage/methylation domain-containing protein [Sulfuricurvum sp.]
MNRKAFTLVEVLISILLFGLISIFLFGAIDQIRNQQTFFKTKEGIIEQKNKIVSLMQSDFDRAQSVAVSSSSNNNFDTASIIGSNRSLYGSDAPFVTWVILKADNTLVRMESTAPISVPINPKALYATHSDPIAQHCEIFRIYDSPSHRLIFLKTEAHPPLMVEVAK